MTATKPQSNAAASGWALIGAVVTTVANFALAALVLLNGTTFAGLFWALTAIVTICGMASSLGTMTGIVYFMPQALDSEQPNPRSLMQVSLIPVVALSFLLFAIFAGAAPFVGRIFGIEATTALRVAAIAIPALALSTNLTGATRALGTMVPTVVINQIVRPGGQLLLIGILFLRGDPSIEAAAAAWAAPIAAGAVLSFVAVQRLGGFVSDGPAAVTTHEFWIYTRARALTTAMQIALERIDVILVKMLAGDAAAGIYGTVTRYATAGNFLAYSISQAVSPNLRRAISRNNTERAHTIMQESTSWLVLVAWPFFLFVSVNSVALAEIFGSELKAGATALTIVAVGLLASSFAGPVDLGLMMSGFPKLAMAGVALALGTDVAGNFALVPTWGIEGAAVAWALAVVAQNGFNALTLQRRTGLHGPGAPSLTAAAIAVVSVVPLGLLLPDTLVGAALNVIVGGLIFVPLTVACRYRFGLGGLDKVLPAPLHKVQI